MPRLPEELPLEPMPALKVNQENLPAAPSASSQNKVEVGDPLQAGLDSIAKGSTVVWTPADTKPALRENASEIKNDSYETRSGVSRSLGKVELAEGPVKAATDSPNYSAESRTITGRVQSWRGSWRLRYADVGEEDQHGGCVMLDNVEERLQDGRQVRVHGHLIPAADRFSSPRFLVQALEVLSK